MPGNKSNPVDGSIIIFYGDSQARGANSAGSTVAEIKLALKGALPEFASLPLDAVARVMTVDPDDDAWKQLPGDDEPGLLSVPADGGVLQMFQGVFKEVPDDYVLRRADICLQFSDRT